MVGECLVREGSAPVNLRSRKTGSLGGAILRLTLLVGLVTITATVIASLASSYRLASAQAAERQRAYLRVADSLIASRLSAASDTADRVTAALLSAPQEPDPTRTLASQYVAENSVVDGLWLVSQDATVLATYPLEGEQHPVESTGIKSAIAE